MKINEADLDLIEQNLIEYLNADDSPFKNYNFKTGVLSGLIRICKFVIRNLSYQLNKEIEEIFLDTALLEDTIYSLIKNFNYIPMLNRPAKKYLKVDFELSQSSFIPSSNPDTLYKLTFNHIKYEGNDILLLPTFRDKWQQNEYTNANIEDFIGTNMFYCYMDLLLITSIYQINPILGLGTMPSSNKILTKTIPIYQGRWTFTEFISDGSDDSQEIELKNMTENTYWGDKIIPESIRVFVKKDGSSIWEEYFDFRIGFIDPDIKSYILAYDKTKGLTIKFGLNHISYKLKSNDSVRVVYAITEGDKVNKLPGKNEFTNTDFWDMSIIEIQGDGTERIIISFTSNKGNEPYLISPNPEDLKCFSAKLIDSNGNLTKMDNGVGKQSIESIKVSAPLFRTTQGRAVTESDYNVLLKQKFVEYADIKAWGGQREYFDMELLFNDSINKFLTYSSGKWSGTEIQVKNMIKNVLEQFYYQGYLTVDDIDYNNVKNGKYRLDVGYVYFSFYDEKFQFVDSKENIDEILRYLDKYKILTMGYKYMNPMFMFLKLNLKLTINQAFSKSFNMYETKKFIYDWINERTKYGNIVDLKELNNILLTNQEISAVDELSYTVKAKVKNVTDYQNEFIYVRFFSELNGEINAKIRVWEDGVYKDISTIQTDKGIVKVNGIVQTGNKVNYKNGFLRFKNWAGTAPIFKANVFYIDDVKLKGYKMKSIRENVLGCEFIDDIQLTVE